MVPPPDESKYVIAGILTAIIVIVLLVFCYRKFLRIKPFEPDVIQYEAIVDNIFSPLRWKFCQMHKIAKTMMAPLRYILLVYNVKKIDNSEDLTLSKLENIVKKDYIGSWNRETKSPQYELLMEKMLSLLKKGRVVSVQKNIRKEFDNARDEHSFIIAISKEARITKKMTFVPFTGYESELSRNVLMISCVCDENMNVIGICSVGNEDFTKVIQN